MTVTMASERPLPPQLPRTGIYLHVPFCPHICPYCDFVKTSRFQAKGVTALLEDARKTFASLAPHYVAWAKTQAPLSSESLPAVTLYFGGGTPGLLDARHYENLVCDVRSQFNVEEFTLETNPYTNRDSRFEGYARLGVDRITLGAQSLDNTTLAFLGRKHTALDVLRSLEQARAAGIKQAQVDLIYGLVAGVRKRSLTDEIRSLAAAGATGISAYALAVESRTSFGQEAARGVRKADDDAAATEYAELLDACEECGFLQVETSNFSRFPSLHNNIYWYGLPYMGLGTGAHGLMPPHTGAPFGTRYRVGSVPKTLAPGDDDLPFHDAAQAVPLFALEKEPVRTASDFLTEMIFTLLRTPTGLPLAWLEASGAPGARQRLLRDGRVARGIAEGLLRLENNTLHVAPHEKVRGDSWCAVIATLCLSTPS
ncbi:MAG: radical SAM protein [Silvanigrellales bacterium]|nr:radical SAM protein [Silvanigrellales bacterium]